MPVDSAHGILSRVRSTLGSPRNLLAAVVVLVVALGTLVPVLFLIFSSFNTALPAEEARYGLENWQAAFADSRISNAIWTTVRLAVTRVLAGSVR